MQKSITSKKPQALTDWTYELLKDQILNLDLLPGEQIHIEEFTEKLGVSRTPIREAFLRLAAEGLVEIRPRVGYFVADITEQDIRDLFEIREIFETRAAAGAAVSLTDSELEKLQKLIENTKHAVQKEDFEAYLSYEMAFHNYLQKHVHNKRLITFIESLNNLTYRERIMSIQSILNIELTVIEHEAIVDALVERDSDKAAWYMGEHLKKVSGRLVEILKSNKKLRRTKK